MILAGNNIPDRQLIENVLRNMECLRGQRNKPRWVLVMDYFAVGSTVAHALCREFGFDPDGVIK